MIEWDIHDDAVATQEIGRLRAEGDHIDLLAVLKDIETPWAFWLASLAGFVILERNAVLVVALGSQEAGWSKIRPVVGCICSGRGG